jgi:uncharacterized membrane protein
VTLGKAIKVLIKPLIAGILAVLPLALTTAIVLWLADILVRLAGPSSTVGAFLKQIGWNLGSTETGAYVGGALFALAIIYVFGLMIQTILKGRWEQLVESIVLRLPIVKTIYDAAKRVVQIVDSGDGTNMFLSTSETVLVQGEEFHVIMIPTAPVPLGGAIMCVPRAWITELDCGIDGLLNVYMSMGTTAPDHVST